MGDFGPTTSPSHTPSGHGLCSSCGGSNDDDDEIPPLIEVAQHENAGPAVPDGNEDPWLSTAVWRIIDEPRLAAHFSPSWPLAPLPFAEQQDAHRRHWEQGHYSLPQYASPVDVDFDMITQYHRATQEVYFMVRDSPVAQFWTMADKLALGRLNDDIVELEAVFAARRFRSSRYTLDRKAGPNGRGPRSALRDANATISRLQASIALRRGFFQLRAVGATEVMASQWPLKSHTFATDMAYHDIRLTWSEQAASYLDARAY